MTHSTNEAETLSRSSDHLGNLANILKDLGGGATLLNELTQNANDAKAHTIRFTSSEDALEVWNSAVFSDCGNQRTRRTCPWKDQGRRSCDLHSFRLVAGRHKAADHSTTGAFGVGFTAVYQVTDHPELVTANWHLILDESNPEDQRIRVCTGGCSRDHGKPGTTFYLPWARANTDLRRDLGTTPLSDDDVELLTAQIHDGATSALVFLENLRSLEVVSPGRRPTKVGRAKKADRITITVNDDASEWLLLEGEMPDADELKAHYGEASSERSTLVQVAVPVHGAAVGRIFADLPTETRTGWSGHVNGTFFPRQDRKTVEFGGQGFRGKWNDHLIDTAAQIAATNLELIADTLGERVAWKYLVDVEKINRAIDKDEYPTPFSAFFTHAKFGAPQASIALLVEGNRVQPYGVLVPQNEDAYQSAGALGKLGMQVLHRSLRPEVLQTSLTQYGMSRLTVDDVVGALLDADITEPWTPNPEALLDNADIESILQLIEALQSRGKTQLIEAHADEVAIVPCIDGSFASAQGTSNLEDDDRALFELLAPDLKILDRDRLEDLCPSLIELCADITPARAIEIFESDPAALVVAPDQILEWLANHRAALASTDLKNRVAALPIFPSTSGELLPLTVLSLPSDFDDVLGVAAIIDREKTAGHEDLLRLLGARELDAVEYLNRHVVPTAHAGHISEDQAASVLEVIHRHRFDLQQEMATLSALAAAPLVATGQGLRPALKVHLPNRELALINPDEPTAAVEAIPSHLVETLVWLGVSRTPNDVLLSAAATRLGQEDGTPDRDVVLAILNSLPNPPMSEEVPGSLQALVTSAWLPTQGGHRAKPRDAYSIFQKYLFDSQGPHLDLPREDQQRLAQVLEWLGVPSTPTTAMVIAHLRHCSETSKEINDQVFRFLGESKNDRAVRELRNFPCVQIAQGEFVEPAFVFWTDPHLGAWAHHLLPAYRQYQTFYDRVGVHESPSPEQLEQVLRRISREVGNDRVEDDDKAVVHRCWELLDELLPASAAVLTKLGAIKSTSGPRDLLEKPELLLFADGRRLAETFALLKDNLIHRDRTTRRALAAAGVRDAEKVIEAHVNSELAYSSADDVEALIRNRQDALARLVDAQRTDEVDFSLDFLAALRLDHMPELAVEYVIRFAGRHYVVEPRIAEAIYLRDDQRLIVRTQSPTRHLARELALCIAPEADVSALAPSILEVLSAKSLAEAMNVLDEYGVRDLDMTSWDVIESSPADEITEASDVDEGPGFSLNPAEDAVEASYPLTEPDEEPDWSDVATPDSTKLNAREQVAQLAGKADDGSEGRREKRRHPRTDRSRAPNTSRLTSYVSFGDSSRDSDAGDEAALNSAVDQAGVKRVLEYEASAGRVPEEQPHSNPGFDVLSKNAEGTVVRCIEIKSIGGPWTERGVLLSSTQFAHAQANPDLYWLYVVEHAEDDDAAVIHRIQNPAGQVTKFGFDSGWQAVDEPEIPRDETGQSTVRLTRGLLGWTASDRDR